MPLPLGAGGEEQLFQRTYEQNALAADAFGEFQDSNLNHVHSRCPVECVLRLLLFIPELPCAAQRRQPIETLVMPFQYSLNSSTIKPTPILKKIEIAAAAGYAAIELWHMDIDAHVEAGGTVEEVRKCVDDNGLKVPTTIHIHNWFQPAGPEHTEAMDEAKRKLEQAAAVGSPFTVAGPPHGTADMPLGKQHYRELLELGSSLVFARRSNISGLLRTSRPLIPPSKFWTVRNIRTRASCSIRSTATLVKAEWNQSRS